MAGTLRSLVARLDMDTKPFMNGVMQVDRQLSSAAKGMDATFKGVASAGEGAEKAFTGVGDAADSAARNVDTGFRGKATGAVKMFGASIVSAGAEIVANFGLMAISAGVQKFGEAIELASNKAESASKVNVLFGDSADIVMKASETATETVLMSSGAYLESAGNLGNLITNFGVAGDEAANMSVDMIQLAADMGSFNNADPSEVVYAMGSALRGETEPIRKFGVMLSQVAVEAKAVEMGLISQGQALDSTSRLQATWALMLEQTTAAQGDVARTIDGLANSQRNASARMEEAWTKLGEILIPIAQFIQGVLADAILGIINTIVGVVESVKGWIDSNGEVLGSLRSVTTLGIDVFVKGLQLIVAVVKPVVDGIISLIQLALGPLLPLTLAVATALTVQLIPSLLKTAAAFGATALSRVMDFVTTLTMKLIPSLGDVSFGLDDVSVKSGGFAKGLLAAIGPQLALTAAISAGVLIAIKLGEVWDMANKYAHELILGTSEMKDGLLQANEVASVTAKTQKILNDEMDTAHEVLVENNDDWGGLSAMYNNAALQLAGLFGQQALNNQLSYEAARANEVHEESVGAVKDAIRAMGPTFELNEQNLMAVATATTTNAETVRFAWEQVGTDIEAENLRISAALQALPADFEMTGSSAVELASSIDVSVDQIGVAWEEMQTTLGNGTDEMALAIQSLPPEFQTFATEAGLSMAQIEQMAAGMPRYWGEAAVEFKAALDQLPPEFRNLAESAGLSTEQVLDWVGRLPPAAQEAAAATDTALEKIIVSVDDVTGALRDLGQKDAPNYFKDFKNATDQLKDPEQRIKDLGRQIENLDKVNLRSLPPAALATWVQTRSDAQRELDGLTTFMDNKGQIIDHLIPEALKQSQIDSATQWNTMLGKTTTTTTTMVDTVDRSASTIAGALPSELAAQQFALSRGLANVQTSANNTYTSVTNTAETQAGATGEALPEGLHTNFSKFTGQMNLIQRTLSEYYEAYARIAGNGGSKVGNEFINELAESIRSGRTKIASAVDYATGPIQANSPPKVGPLRNIDKMARSLGILWVDEMSAGISQRWVRMNEMTLQPKSPTSIGDNAYAGNPEFARTTDGHGYAPLIGEQHFHVYDADTDKVERAVERANRRTILEADLV